MMRSRAALAGVAATSQNAALPPVPTAYDWGTLADKGRSVVRALVSFHGSVAVAPAPTGPAGAIATLPESLEQRAGAGLERGSAAAFDALVSTLDTNVFASLPRVGSDPLYVGGTAASAVSPPALLGEAMALAINQPGFSWQCTPIATELEAMVCDWLIDALGLPADRFAWAGGIGGMAMQSTCSEALTVAILGARERARVRRRDLTRAVIYTGPLANGRVERAAAVAGIPIVRRVPAAPGSDDPGALDPAMLLEAMRVDAEMGLAAVGVVASVGTRHDAGADAIAALADLCARQKVHLTVDAGAHCMAATCEELRPVFAGWERADAIVMSAGAWLPTGQNSAFCAFADRKSVNVSLNATGVYLENEHTAKGTVVDFKDYHLGLGRPFRSLKVYTTLMALGLDGVRGLVRRHVALAKAMTSALADAGVATGRECGLGSVTVRIDPDESASAAADRVKASRGVTLGTAATGYLRASLASPWSDEQSAGAVASAMAEAAGSAEAAAGAIALEVSRRVDVAALPAVPSCLEWVRLQEPMAAVMEDVAKFHGQDLGARDPESGLAAPTLPPLPAVTPGFVKGLSCVPASAPDAAAATLEAIAATTFRELVVPATSHWHHPRFFNFFPCMISPAGLLGDMLGLALNQPCATHAAAPAATELEYYVGDRYAALWGLPVATHRWSQDPAAITKKLTSTAYGGSGGGALLQPSATEAMILMQLSAKEAKLKEIDLAAFGGIVRGAVEDDEDDDDEAMAMLKALTQKAAGGARGTNDSIPLARATAAARFVVYYSADAHFAVEKAVKALGIQHARKVPTVPTNTTAVAGTTSSCPPGQRNTMMDVRALEAVINDDVVEGLIPFFLAGNVGATGTGAVDDVAALRRVADTHGMWLNLDCAYAGVVSVSEQERAACPAFAAWQKADSLLVNLSKWNAASFNSNVLFTRHPAVLASAMNSGTDPKGIAAPLDLRHTHLGSSQVARGLKLLMVAEDFGGEGFTAIIERHCALARYLTERLRATFGAETVAVADAAFGLVCFSCVGAGPDATQQQVANVKLAALLTEKHDSWIGCGQRHVRVSLAHPGLTHGDMDALVAAVAEHLPAALGAAGKPTA